MNLTMELYRALYGEIETKNYSLGSSVYRKAICDCGEGILYSVSIKDKMRALSIPVSADDTKYPEVKGIELSLVTLKEYSNSNQVYLQIKQNKDTEIYIYEILIEDIRTSLSKVKSSKEFPSTIQRVLKKWKKFFSSNKEILLSEINAQGLYGELLFLQTLINAKGANAIESWVGITSATHDFYIGQNAVEIKTTATQTPYYAHINNEFQLDNNDVNGKLFLRFYAFRKSPIGGQKLPELVSIIREQLENDILFLDAFNSKLEEAGYIDAASTHYTTGYTLREVYMFEVGEDFPKIQRESIPKGITNLKYNLSISNCLDYAIDCKDISTIIKG